jgi:glycosyltransferase involved in cell wall biosynthesis
VKILYAFNYYQQHGGENQWYRSEPELFASRGHEVSIYSRDNKELENFSVLQKAALFWRTTWSEETYQAVRKLLQNNRPDIVHVYNTLVLISPSIFHACRDEGVPVVQTLYNYRPVCPIGTFLRDHHICEECLEHSLWRNVRYACYRGSHLQSAALSLSLYRHRKMGTWRDCISSFIVPTPFMKAKLAQGGLPIEKIVVKPNWHSPDPSARTGPGENTVLYVGRLTPEKGIDLLFKTWRAATHGTLPQLRIIGDGPLREEVVAFVAANPDAGVEYLGRRSHDEVIDEMKRAGALVIPSLWYEAFPHTILEASACGVPIIASRLGTLPDVIDDEITGLLFEPGKSADLAAKIGRMFSHDGGAALREKLGAAARAKFLREYTSDHAYESLMQIYDDAIGRLTAIPASIVPART